MQSNELMAIIPHLYMFLTMGLITTLMRQGYLIAKSLRDHELETRERVQQLESTVSHVVKDQFKTGHQRYKRN